MNRAEQRYLFLYVSNMLKSRFFRERKLNDLVEWHADYGRDYISFKWATAEEEIEYPSFEKFAAANRNVIKQRVQSFQKLLEKKLAARVQKPSLFENKMKQLEMLLGLSEISVRILGCMARIKLNPEFERLYSCVSGRGCDFRTILPYWLDISQSCLEKETDKTGMLHTYGLIDKEYDGDISLSQFSLNLLSSRIKNPDDIKRFCLGKQLAAELTWEDFSYVPEKEFCAKLLEKAVKHKEKGVNILFYGQPGTGKTEFAKTLADKVRTQLYAVGENSNDNSRLSCLKMANKMLRKDRNTCLLVDEADDVLEKDSLFTCRSKGESNKLQVNRQLENNLTPTVWIINSIKNLDKAYLRRFTYAVDFHKPGIKERKRIWQKTLKSCALPCTDSIAEDFAMRYKVSPSFITTAVKAAKLAGGSFAEVKQTLNSLEKAYNDGSNSLINVQTKTEFNLNLLNTDVDLSKLAEQVNTLSCRNFSLCLYGVSGTGKSAYAEYLADSLGIPVIKKKCSDLLSRWVGGTEENIAEAFSEGLENQAMLVFDEADSFLQNRTSAVHSWEITQVNEMLTQMENYPYPFVCTTNLIENLDKASLRRFTFKVQCGYMTPEQRTEAFKHFFHLENADLSALNSLTPGDFVVVKHKAEILGVMTDTEELLNMLELEQKNKESVTGKIGFL